MGSYRTADGLLSSRGSRRAQICSRGGLCEHSHLYHLIGLVLGLCLVGESLAFGHICSAASVSFVELFLFGW